MWESEKDYVTYYKRFGIFPWIKIFPNVKSLKSQFLEHFISYSFYRINLFQGSESSRYQPIKHLTDYFKNGKTFEMVAWLYIKFDESYDDIFSLTWRLTTESLHIQTHNTGILRVDREKMSSSYCGLLQKHKNKWLFIDCLALYLIKYFS